MPSTICCASVFERNFFFFFWKITFCYFLRLENKVLFNSHLKIGHLKHPWTSHFSLSYILRLGLIEWACFWALSFKPSNNFLLTTMSKVMMLLIEKDLLLGKFRPYFIWNIVTSVAYVFCVKTMKQNLKQFLLFVMLCIL